MLVERPTVDTACQTSGLSLEFLQDENATLRARIKELKRANLDSEKRLEDYIRQSADFKGKLEELDRAKASLTKL
jgi:hypothetical protein